MTVELHQKIYDVYKPLLERKYTYYYIHSGRGIGKTTSISLILLLLSLKRKEKILCLRKTMNSINESTKATLERVIFAYGLEPYFTITNYSIISVTGSEFIFRGLHNESAVYGIKSMSGITITWLDEASQIRARDQYIWDIVIPSVLRTPPKPIVIFSFNPEYEDDVVYVHSKIKRDDSITISLTHSDNPFFPGSSLEKEMIEQKKTSLPEVWDHIWGGKTKKKSLHSMFKNVDFTPFPRAREYEKYYISVDPAGSSSGGGDEWGILLAGFNNNRIDILEDLSGSYTPFEAAKIIMEKYNKNSENTKILIESNFGGTLGKTLLQTFSLSVNVEEVHVRGSKANRMSPVAIKFQMGFIRLCGSFPLLLKELDMFTVSNEYIGKVSPNRADSLSLLCNTISSYQNMREDSLDSWEGYVEVKTISLNELIFLKVYKNVNKVRFKQVPPEDNVENIEITPNYSLTADNVDLSLVSFYSIQDDDMYTLYTFLRDYVD